jgi:hypothetical protein
MFSGRCADRAGAVLVRGFEFATDFQGRSRLLLSYWRWQRSSFGWGILDCDRIALATKILSAVMTRGDIPSAKEQFWLQYVSL